MARPILIIKHPDTDINGDAKKGIESKLSEYYVIWIKSPSSTEFTFECINPNTIKSISLGEIKEIKNKILNNAT